MEKYILLQSLHDFNDFILGYFLSGRTLHFITFLHCVIISYIFLGDRKYKYTFSCSSPASVQKLSILTTIQIIHLCFAKNHYTQFLFRLFFGTFIWPSHSQCQLGIEKIGQMRCTEEYDKSLYIGLVQFKREQIFVGQRTLGWHARPGKKPVTDFLTSFVILFSSIVDKSHEMLYNSA